jgi:exodeoxyribonuclease VII small subunit
MARPADPPARAPELSFEGALERLEAIVAELESGELDLERALAAFEEGVALSRRCTSQLEDAERRIERLVGGPDGAGREPFRLGDEGEPGEPGPRPDTGA